MSEIHQISRIAYWLVSFFILVGSIFNKQLSYIRTRLNHIHLSQVRHFWILILFFGIGFLFSSCTPSLVYSPALNPGGKPLQKNEGLVSVGAEALNEVRPDAANKNLVFGPDASVSYGFSDKFSMQARIWFDGHNMDPFRSGYSITGYFNLDSDNNSNSRSALVPTIVGLFDNKTLEGIGVTLRYCRWFQTKNDLKYYTAAGLVFGFRNEYPMNNQYGEGGIINLGANYSLSKYFSANLEISSTGVYNSYDMKWNYYISPAFSILYKF